jgi:hypothetical protein
MSKRTNGPDRDAVGAIPGVGRSAVAQDPTIADHRGRVVARRHDQIPLQLEGEGP